MIRLLLALAAMGAALSPVPVQAQRPAASFAAEAQDISFELYRGTRIFFEGRVNGQPAMMMLDSGAGATVLDRAFAQRIGVAEGRVQPVQGAGGIIQGRIASGVTLQAGSLTVAGAAVLVFDIQDLAHQIGRPIDVILGMETFRAGIVDIDFPRRRLRFARADGFTPPAGAVAVPISEENGRRTIAVDLGAGPVAADLDIGHGGSLILSRDYWESHAEVARLPSVPSSAAGVGGRVPKRWVTLPSVSFGGHRFRGVPALLNEGARDLPVSGANIGIDLLQRFRLVFDYRRHILYLVPDEAAMAQPLHKNRHGLRLELQGDRLRVAEVMPGSPAAEAGWRVGDEVVSVNGRRVDPRYFFRDDANFNAQPAGTRIDLERADGRHMPVTLRDFF